MTTPRQHTLPNGLTVAYQSKAELLQFYEDIFEKRIYTRRGIALRDGDCVFDVGANIGLFTVFAALSFPAVTVFSFEPAPPLQDVLRANAAPYGDRVRVVPCGLSSRAGSAELTFYPHSSGMSSFYPDQAEETAALRMLIRNELARGKTEMGELLRFEDELVEERLRGQTWTCPLRTLSEVIREHGVQRIDLLKIDVEKSELDVLDGLDDEDWGKVEQAVVEVHDREDKLREVSSRFQAHGFNVALEQDDLYLGSDRYNLYALRQTLAREQAPSRVPYDRTASLGRAEDRARKLRGAALRSREGKKR